MFQVTKRGDSVIVLLRWDVRRGCKPIGTNDVEELSGVVFALPAEREVVDVEFDEEVLIVERELWERRCRAGILGRGRSLVDV